MARTAGTAVMLAGALALGGCGLIGESDELQLGVAAASDEAIDAAPGPDESTPDAPGAPPSTAGIGETFTDPQGTYEIEVDPTWIPQHGSLAAEIELWYLGRPEGRFASNVNVLTQLTPDVGLEEYLDLSVQNAELVIEGAELVNRGIVHGTYQQLGFMEYRATQFGGRLHFLAYFTVDDGVAVVATLTAAEEEFAEARPAVEPHLQTLRSLPG